MRSWDLYVKIKTNTQYFNYLRAFVALRGRQSIENKVYKQQGWRLVVGSAAYLLPDPVYFNK